MILEKIESSILNGLGYIVRLEKKNGNKEADHVMRLSKKNRRIDYESVNEKIFLILLYGDFPFGIMGT